METAFYMQNFWRCVVNKDTMSSYSCKSHRALFSLKRSMLIAQSLKDILYISGEALKS
jgi:hypothetical protein